MGDHTYIKERESARAREREVLLQIPFDVYYYICQRLKLKEETENMGVCTKEREGQRYS